MTEPKTNREKYHYKCHKCENKQSILNRHCSNCGIEFTTDEDLVEGPVPEIDLEEKIRRLSILIRYELMISCPNCNAVWDWSPLDNYCFNCGRHVTNTDRVRAVKRLRDEVSTLRKEFEVLKERIPDEPKLHIPWWWRFWGK